MKELYSSIFIRKSMRRFEDNLQLSDDELLDIKQQLEKLMPLEASIKVKFIITPRTDTTAKRGQYCILLYSETQPNYLLNAGFMLEQLDLYLASKSIGACWYGMAKPKETQIKGLDFVIMMAVGKCSYQQFRNGISDFKRKELEIIWQGHFDHDVKEAVRLAPSACNTQPWRIISNENFISVYRSTRIKSFIPASKLPYYNSVDMGICLCFLETALLKKSLKFERSLSQEENTTSELVEIAKYRII